MLKKLRVLVVDDSTLMRAVISDVISADPSFEVVGTAADGKMAVERTKALQPDVITMDVEMPVMDGIEAVREIMSQRPTPVVMLSSITYEGSHKTMQALSAGAFDFVQKPKAQLSTAINDVSAELRAKLRSAVESGYVANRKVRAEESASAAGKAPAQVVLSVAAPPARLLKLAKEKDFLIAIGISTGGPPCLSKIFEAMPENAPPVVVVQHMPEGFTKAMADRLNSHSKMEVKETADGDVIRTGHGYIAPGNKQIKVVREAGILKLKVNQDEPMSGHRPSADYLFRSIVETCGSNVLAVIMTGMGRDGVTHLKQLRDKGVFTIAQDESSSVVFGMPKIAIQEGAAEQVLSLDEIVTWLSKLG